MLEVKLNNDELVEFYELNIFKKEYEIDEFK